MYDTVSCISMTTGPITIEIDNTTSNYSINFLNENWLISGSVFINNNKTIYSTSDASLSLISTSLNKGNDNNLGTYTSYDTIWQMNDVKLSNFKTSIIIYDNLDGVIIFEQHFLSQIFNSSQSSPWSSTSKCVPPVGYQCKGFDTLNSGFPTFMTNNGIFTNCDGMRFIHWNGIQGHYAHNGNQNEFYYPQKTGDGFFGSYLGGTPLILFNENKAIPKHIMILSQLNHFKTSTFAMTNKNQLSAGIGGLTDNVKPNTIHRTILYAAIGVDDNNVIQNSISDAMHLWGDIMLLYNNKKRKSMSESNDLSISHLGYWADNGAYYCLISETNKSYETTMIDIKNYLDDKDVLIPIHYFQLDWSWYYPQCFDEQQSCAGWSVTNWTADIYDNSMYPNGLQWLYQQLINNKTDKLRGFDLHNRQWHPVNYYSINNEFQFIIEGNWINVSNPQSVGLPVNMDSFFYSLFTNRTKDGLWIYEKDYLFQQFVGMFMDFSNLTYYESYLSSMNNIAIKVCNGSDIKKCGNNGILTIQYCTASPNDILSSITLDRVTQVRVSTDYMAGSQQPGGDWNWHIADISLLASSVGLAPFKDNFWTTQYQTGNPWNVNEPNPSLNALISSLSNGPIGIGDKIGCSNKIIIMTTCRDDGLLLKSDRSVVPIDRRFSSNSYTNSSKIWYSYSTYTVNNNNFTWFYLLIADFYDINYYLTFHDFGPKFANNLYKNYLLTPLNITYNIDIYNKYNSGKYIWNNSQNLNLDKMRNTTKIYKQGFVPQKVPYQYYILSPQLDSQNNWYLIGEYTKYITMSHQRFKNNASIIINTENNNLIVNVEGVIGETIFVKAYYKPNQILFTQSCIVINNDNICQIIFSV